VCRWLDSANADDFVGKSQPVDVDRHTVPCDVHGIDVDWTDARADRRVVSTGLRVHATISAPVTSVSFAFADNGVYLPSSVRAVLPTNSGTVVDKTFSWLVYCLPVTCSLSRSRRARGRILRSYRAASSRCTCELSGYRLRSYSRGDVRGPYGANTVYNLLNVPLPPLTINGYLHYIPGQV